MSIPKLFYPLVVFAVFGCTGLHTTRAQIIGPVNASDILPITQLAEAQRQALAQHKPVGFLLIWPEYFTASSHINHRGSGFTSRFYAEFKDRCVLVNVSHDAAQFALVPRMVMDTLLSSIEAKTAPCLCVVNPTLTKILGIVGQWKNDDEREQSFARMRALIADKGKWWEEPQTRTAAAIPRPTIAPLPPQSLPLTAPVHVSSAFEREMELTRQAEQQARQPQAPPKVAPSSKPQG